LELGGYQGGKRKEGTTAKILQEKKMRSGAKNAKLIGLGGVYTEGWGEQDTKVCGVRAER